MKKYIILLLATALLSGCGLLKKDRVLVNKQLEKVEFGFNTFFFPSQNLKNRVLIVFLSGDGGWLKFPDTLCKEFSSKGFATLGINTRSYFWEKRTPKSTSADLKLLIRSYLKKTNTSQIYLAGYSFGADVIPFVYNELPFLIKMRVKNLILLSPFATTDFQIHLADLLGSTSDNYNYSVVKEIQKVKIPVFCFYGDNEDQGISPLKTSNFELKILKGDHQYELDEIPKILETIPSPKK